MNFCYDNRLKNREIDVENLKLFFLLSKLGNIKNIYTINIDWVKLMNSYGLKTLQNICSYILDIQRQHPKCKHCKLRICNCEYNLDEYYTVNMKISHLLSENHIINFLKSVTRELKNPYDDNVYGLLILEIKLLEMDLLVDTQFFKCTLEGRDNPWEKIDLHVRLCNIHYITKDFALDRFMKLWNVPKTDDINKNITSIIKKEYSVIKNLVYHNMIDSYWLDVFDNSCVIYYNDDTNNNDEIFMIDV